MTFEAFLRLPAIIRGSADLSARFQAHRVGVLDSDGQSISTYVTAWISAEERFADAITKALKEHVDDDSIRRQIVTYYQSECRNRVDEIIRIRAESRRAYVARESEIYANNQREWVQEEENLFRTINSVLADVPK